MADTPEEPKVMFDLPENGETEEHTPLTPDGNGTADWDRKHIGGTQADILELSTLITNPGLKRTESTDLLNWTLHQCARDGNADNMKRMLQSLTGNIKKKVNQHDEEDISALHYASRYNHYAIVKLLVEFGANPNNTDEEGATPLIFAARYKRMRFQQVEDGETDGAINTTVDDSVILYLVSQGAEVNKADIYGCTPLHFAAMRGNEVATKELLSCNGIDIEYTDKQQMTAIHMATSHGETEVCRMLIEQGTNLRCCDEDMCTPLHYACMEGSAEVVQMLFEAGEKQDGWVTVSQMVSDEDMQQNTPLHLAVENSSHDVAKMCIEKGADVNVPRSNYQTSLHLAATAGDIQIMEMLEAHNARIDALDINQSTPLHKAAAYNHADAVRFLIDKGARIDKHDKDNFTPLLIAASNGHAETIRELLKHGADIFAMDKYDKGALFWAAEEDNLQAMKVLLEHPKCAELLDQSDRYDNTPLHIASQKGYINCVRALLDAEADMDAKNEEEQTPLHLAAKSGKTGVVRELVRRNKQVINDEDEDSNTALHLASLAGHNKVVSSLLDRGADIEARNCTLWTPLDCAAAKGFHKTVRVLLEADAPVDPMDKTKTTPLHLASSRGHVQVVQLLLQWHANATQRDTDGLNCMDMAIENGNKDVAIAIINSPKWKESLRNETLDLNTGHRSTPMRKLIKKMPDVAEKVFNNCTSQNMTNADHPNYKITFNYEFLDDQYSTWTERDQSDNLSVSDSVYDEDSKLLPHAKPYSSDSAILKDNHPLSIMTACFQEDLLAHPLVTSLLRHKWQSYGRYVYYLNLFIYLIFLIFLTGYILTTDAPYKLKKDSGYSNSSANNSLCEYVRTQTKNAGNQITQDIFATIGKYVIMGLAGINILREVYQIFNSKLNYLGWENLIEWITYVCAFLLVIDFNSCQQDTGIRTDWQWQLAAVGAFLAWIDLVLFIRKIPLFGIYVVMFTDILYTFVQFFPVFLLFIWAFALSFFILMQNQYEFRGIGNSLIKTSVMMIGEFEFGDIFLGLESADDQDVDDIYLNTVFYETVTYILFVAFLIIMAILIMNLLVGLAVDDIKAVQEQAVLKRLAMQVELVMEVESKLPHFIQRRFIVKSQTLAPNSDKGNPINRLLQSSSLTGAAIKKALDPEMDEWEVVQENQDKMMKQLATVRTRVKQLDQQNQQMASMLTAIVKHHNIELEDEDFIADEDGAN